jgi:hypothetical protein
MNLLKRLREQKDNKDFASRDRVREESQEEIGEGEDHDDEAQQRDFHPPVDESEIEISNHRLGESSELAMH